MKGLYIHIPFCKKKCKYCDFVSYAGAEKKMDEYIAALKREAYKYKNEKIDTIFVGGGTPTVFSPEQIKRTAKMCFDIFDVSREYEFTFEANPGTLNNEKIKAMLDGGANRVSVGVQSFNDAELKRIGRIHSAAEAYDTVLMLRNAGFLDINIDLMTSLPAQTGKSLKETLETTVSLPITHISAYSLIIEEGTPFWEEYNAGRLKLPSDEEDRKMYAYVTDFLAQRGFNKYEISNFAQNGFECRHNIKYWTGIPYIGLGAAAHSYTGEKRYWNSSNLEKYIAGEGQETIYLSDEDKISEFMITGLRMSRGVSAAVFAERFGEDISKRFGKILDKFTDGGFMQKDGDYYFLTERGINVSNSILCEFV